MSLLWAHTIDKKPEKKPKNTKKKKVLSAPTPETQFLRCLEIGPATILLQASGRNQIFISGFSQITLLHGNAQVGCHDLVIGKNVDIRAPIWHPAWILDCATRKLDASNPDPDEKGKILQMLRGKIATLSDSVDKDLLSFMTSYSMESGCLLLITGIDFNKQDWLIQSEDQTAYSTGNRSSVTVFPKPEIIVHDIEQTTFYLGFESGAIGSRRGLKRSAGVDCFDMPESWSAAIDDISLDICGANTVLPEGQLQQKKVLICGAKGVGKSTCLKHLVNRVLSSAESVCVLDCDAGQPEFGIPGQLCLHIIDSPCVAPAHLNIRKPELSFFYGELTAKSNPDYLLQAVQALLTRYEEIVALINAKREEELQRARLEGEEIAAKAAAAKEVLRNQKRVPNRFDILNWDDDDEVATSKSKKRSALPLTDETLPQKLLFKSRLPLVVNTDGFVRFLGAEILHAIVGAVKPHHVFHISTAKDSDLPAIRPLREPGSGTKVHVLEAGRTTPSKITAVDLRTLRFAAYFLGGTDALRFQHPLLRNQFSSGTLPDPTCETIADKSQAQVQIRSAAILDPSGTLPVALMGAPSYLAPFSSVCLTDESASVAPRLLLASINSSFVGIVRMVTAGSHSEEAVSGGLKPVVKKYCEFVATRESCLPTKPSVGNPETFKVGIECAVGLPLQPCIALGIVVGIDFETQSIQIIVPNQFARAGDVSNSMAAAVSTALNDRLEASFTAEVFLVRSNIPVPSPLLYCPASPLLAYYAGESVGEGVTVMKNRRTVKRRRQN